MSEQDHQTPADPLHPSRLTPVLVHLLKKILYRDEHARLWQDLLQLESQVRDQLHPLGLGLELDIEEGFAYLLQKTAAQDEPEIPRLIQRRSLSYPVSLLCVLLRKRLAQADHQGGDTRIIVTQSQLANDIKAFLPSQSNEAKLMDELQNHIRKVCELGLLKRLKEEEHFEIRRLLKKFVDADWLVEFQLILNQYKQYQLKMEQS